MRNIFVSSTFQDMHIERDAIRQKVFPAINREASSHNDHIGFCDLRCGIDTSTLNERHQVRKTNINIDYAVSIAGKDERIR